MLAEQEVPLMVKVSLTGVQPLNLLRVWRQVELPVEVLPPMELEVPSLVANLFLTE